MALQYYMSIIEAAGGGTLQDALYKAARALVAGQLASYKLADTAWRHHGVIKAADVATGNCRW